MRFLGEGVGLAPRRVAVQGAPSDGALRRHQAGLRRPLAATRRNARGQPGLLRAGPSRACVAPVREVPERVGRVAAQRLVVEAVGGACGEDVLGRAAAACAAPCPSRCTRRTRPGRPRLGASTTGARRTSQPAQLAAASVLLDLLDAEPDDPMPCSSPVERSALVAPPARRAASRRAARRRAGCRRRRSRRPPRPRPRRSRWLRVGPRRWRAPSPGCRGRPTVSSRIPSCTFTPVQAKRISSARTTRSRVSGPGARRGGRGIEAHPRHYPGNDAGRARWPALSCRTRPSWDEVCLQMW